MTNSKANIKDSDTNADHILDNSYSPGNTYQPNVILGCDLTIESKNIKYESKRIYVEISTPLSRKQAATVAINQQLKKLT